VSEFLPNFTFKPFTGVIEQADDNDTDPLMPQSAGKEGCDFNGPHTHVHEHIHKHRHENEYVMPPDECPDPKTTREIDQIAQSHGLNPGFIPYGMPVSTAYTQQLMAANGLPPQFLNTPFSKHATAEQIMTVFGELVNEYKNDQTMTMGQIDVLLRQRLKQKYNSE